MNMNDEKMFEKSMVETVKKREEKMFEKYSNYEKNYCAAEHYYVGSSACKGC